MATTLCLFVIIIIELCNRGFQCGYRTYYNLDAKLYFKGKIFSQEATRCMLFTLPICMIFDIVFFAILLTLKLTGKI